MISSSARLIETDEFPFEFLSQLAERESWRKEIHRPIYHVHKWWAKRLGSVFRGILLGGVLPKQSDFVCEFYRDHTYKSIKIFDPFMGSGTTVGEAHKLGMTALGRDINPVAVQAVRTALGPLDARRLQEVFENLALSVGQKIRNVYSSTDSQNRRCDVLYFFWVMQAHCPECQTLIDLFPSYVVARNAYPDRKPEIQMVCPQCGDIFPGLNGQTKIPCRRCNHVFDPTNGPASGSKAVCTSCSSSFSIVRAMAQLKSRPRYRLFGKLVLTRENNKEYLATTLEDAQAYQNCESLLEEHTRQATITLPDLPLEQGHNTKQAMNYGFTNWRDFFNDRQLLTLGWLHREISQISDQPVRDAFFTLFSGVLEFNNLFASYKGEGTGAVRHMFSHHILKPERVPIEANPWGTPKSSGAFSNLFRTRLLRAVEYRRSPVEIQGKTGQGRVCSQPFTGQVRDDWPPQAEETGNPRQIYLSCGDSSMSELEAKSMDLVVTDPPFFDNVHYSELADFFFAWQKLHPINGVAKWRTTRHQAEVQDENAEKFAAKLKTVFSECHRILVDDGLLIFTYHHSRDEGWKSLAKAIWNAGFCVVNSHPVKAEMSVATPKSQTKEPIQLDMILVCRKQESNSSRPKISTNTALNQAQTKLDRLTTTGFSLSRNDRKVALMGQLLTVIADPADVDLMSNIVLTELDRITKPSCRQHAAIHQPLLFDA